MNKLLKINPEFAKNIWLEFSWQRLLVMPFAIAMICVLIFVSESDNEDYMQEVMEGIHTFSLVGFVGVCALWGMKNAGDSITDEYNEKTWDWQKMSITGPWKLTWGKLLGSTIYNWYGGLLCMGLFFATGGYTNYPQRELVMGFVYIVAALLAQGLIILFALQVIRKADGRAKVKSATMFVAIGFIFFGGAGFIASLTEALHYRQTEEYVKWYGMLFTSPAFYLFTAITYLAWVVAGIYRAMRAELQFADKPVWWLVLLVFNLAFAFGILVSMPDVSRVTALCICLGVGFGYYLILSYLLALSEPKDIVNFRLLVSCFKSGNYRKLTENLSLWMVTLPVAFLVGITALVITIIVKADLSSVYNDFAISDGGSGTLLCILIAVFGFVVRDIGVMLLLNLSAKPKRADGAWVLYLALIYLVFSFVGYESNIGMLFYPDVKANKLLMILPPMIEAAIVAFLVVNRWKKVSATELV